MYRPGGITARLTTPNPALIQTTAQAEFWRAELQTNPSIPLQEVTRKLGVEPGYVRRLINAAYLAPEIKRAIFQGTQPEHLQPRRCDKNRENLLGIPENGESELRPDPV